MKLRCVTPMRIAKYGYIMVSILFCLAGIAMILLPVSSVKVIGICFGIGMLLFGIVKLVGYFSKDLFRLAFQYDLQFGILLLLLGLLTLVKPGNVMNFICIAFGVCIIADCLFKVTTALEARHFGIRQWWLTLVLAVFTGIIGMLLAFRPTESMQVLVILLGISILAEGILNLGVAISLVKIVKHQVPDVVDVEEYKIWEEK